MTKEREDLIRINSDFSKSNSMLSQLLSKCGVENRL